MKKLTVAVPVHNAERYLRDSLDSMLGYLDQIEVIAINDGSEDRSGEILQEYAERYPDDIKIVEKEYGGLGAAINIAMEKGTAPWFRTLDPDDRFDQEALGEFLGLLADLEDVDLQPEMIVNDFNYYLLNKDADNEYVSGTYENVFPGPGTTSWSRMRNFRVDQILGNQTLTYNRKLLEKIELKLPEQQMYAYEVYAYEPLPHVRRICYFPHPLYIYTLGREGQTSHLVTMVANFKNLLLTTLEMFRRVRIDSVRPQKLRRYMYRHMSRMIATCMMLMRTQSSGEVECLRQMDILWNELAGINRSAVRKMRSFPILNAQRLLKASSSYTKSSVYNLIGKVFIL